MRRHIIAALLFVAASACAQEIDIENQPASITSVGPLSLDQRDNVVVPFTVRDPEGDDQTALVEICDAPDDNCLTAAMATGSDPMDRLPTVPRREDVLHEFRWQPWCGRWADDGLEPAAIDDQFVAAVRLLPGTREPIYSEPFSLSDLGALEAGACE